MADAPTVIDVHGLTKRFGGRTVVDDVSMTVSRGQILGGAVAAAGLLLLASGAAYALGRRRRASA